jgi:tetratricopeptide (TPR) repeat protein
MSKKNSISRFQQIKNWVVALSPRTKVIVMIAVIFVVVIIALLFLVSATNKKQDAPEDIGLTAEQKAKRDANVKQVKREGALRDSAQEAIVAGDLQKASDIYRAAIQAEADTTKKIKLYLDQSGVLYDAGKYAEAIAVAREAESLSDDKFLVADWLSRIYEDQRQYAKAADYYNLAAKWASSATNKARLNADYYKSQAARVSVLVGQSR